MTFEAPLSAAGASPAGAGVAAGSDVGASADDGAAAASPEGGEVASEGADSAVCCNFIPLEQATQHG